MFEVRHAKSSLRPKTLSAGAKLAGTENISRAVYLRKDDELADLIVNNTRKCLKFFLSLTGFKMFYFHQTELTIIVTLFVLLLARSTVLYP